MSRGMNISIFGMYQYDPTLFDDMSLPTQLDHDTLVYNLVSELAEMEVLYPSPDFLKQAITFWSAKRLNSWQKMADVLTEDYDPFVNIKRDEVRTIVQDRDLKGTSTGTNTQKTNAFNSGTGTERETIAADGETTDTGTVTTTEHFHVEGDSAITDAQDVMKKEVEVRQLYDIYDIIIKDFRDRFCLRVY